MTLEEFIEYFRHSTAIGFSFAESQQIANYLEELEIYKKAYKLLIKEISLQRWYSGGGQEEVFNYYLQKAREEE